MTGCPKLILFKSFTAGLSVQEFDDIYNKENNKKICQTQDITVIKKKE
jgi:hypothetical protein